jgi:hypothetical protein
MENTENSEKIIGKNEMMGSLFDSIDYTSNEQINTFIDNMTEEQAIYCIEQAIHSCHSRGSFTLLESEVISKSLRRIKIN